MLPSAAAPIEVGLLTGGQDRHYAFGLAMALTSRGVAVDVIGSDEVDSAEFHRVPGLRFHNLRGSQRRDVGLVAKVWRVSLYYARLIRYAATATPKVLHILWNNRLEFFDRTLLMLYYKALGKKITLTAHNVNQGKRDASDTLLNHLTLKMQYRLADHIFVHTERMRSELLDEFGISSSSVTVIPYGINNAIPDTDLTPDQAKERLGIRPGEQTLLFFGSIAPYKGLEFLVSAFQQVMTRRPAYRLIIAGLPKKGCERYWDTIAQTISHGVARGSVIQRIQYIPDDDTELYFKAADVLVLPYTHIFQSGVLFLGYSFGLPVIAADVGSLRDDVVEGDTGFVVGPGDAEALAKTIETYFASSLYEDLMNRRSAISAYAHARHSWDAVAEMTRAVYALLLDVDSPKARSSSSSGPAF